MQYPRRPLVRLAATALVGGITLCAGVAQATSEPPDTTAPTTTRPAPTTTRPATTTTEPAPEIERQPLTGVPIDGDTVTFEPRPAMTVKIDNVGAGRNQSGLNQADVVYEEIVEGRATRFVGVFNSMESNPVGPIRSGRTQDVNLLANLNGPIYVWSGGNAAVVSALQATGWTLLGQGTPGFFRSGDRGAPHNLFANMEALWPQAGDAGDAVPIFDYLPPGRDQGGEPVTFAEMAVGGLGVRWDWDADQGLFMRSQQGSPHGLTDGQASTNNVIVLVVDYRPSPADIRSPEAQTVGSGPAVVYSNGRKLEGTWARERPEDPWTLEAGGQPILLAPGRTWVELVDDQHNLNDG